MSILRINEPRCQEILLAPRYPSPNARLRDSIFKAEVFMSGESTRQIGARLLKYNPQSGRRAPPGGPLLEGF